MTRSRVRRFGVALAVVSVVGCGVAPFSTEDSARAARFQRVQWSLGGGPCTEEMDCVGFYELRADGTFRVDRFGEYRGGVHEVTLPAEEVESTVALATDGTLLKLLRRGPHPCDPVTDSSNGFTVELEGERLQAELAGCDEPSVEALRRALLRLEDTYVK